MSKATGLNITLAYTEFNQNHLGSGLGTAKNEIIKPLVLYDYFVTCSVHRDHSYTLTINVELNNPFKVIEIHYQMPNEEKEASSFKILMPQSTFLVKLNQRISYDECLEVKYVQLAPNVSYEIECATCSEQDKSYLDKILKKRMTQLDAELDSLLSEKLLLGLQTLLSQQRLDLELYMS